MKDEYTIEAEETGAEWEVCRKCAHLRARTSYDCLLRLHWMDSQIRVLIAERAAWAEDKAEIRELIDQLRALYSVNLRLLGIVNKPDDESGDQSWQRKVASHRLQNSSL